MRKFKNEFWNTLTKNEKIEFGTIGVLLTNITVGVGYIILDIL